MLDELGPPAVPPRCHYAPASRTRSSGCTEVPANEVQAEVDAGGAAGGGEDAAVVDKQHVLVDLYAGEKVSQLLAERPVSGGSLPVEHAGGRKYER